MGRIGVAETLDETLERSQIIIESVFEDAALKRDLFNQMAESLAARAVPPDQITICSNTMTLPMQAIIEDVQQKEYRGSCIGMRFLHPVWFIDEVELTDCDYTAATRPPPPRRCSSSSSSSPSFTTGATGASSRCRRSRHISRASGAVPSR